MIRQDKFGNWNGAKRDETMGEMDQTAIKSLRIRICAALKQAEVEDANSVRAQTLRLLSCALQDRDMLARSRGDCSGCGDSEILSLLETMVAQRNVSAAQYDESGRISDAEREREEIEIIEAFLPVPLSGEALTTAAAEVVADLEAEKLTDVGRCMSELRTRFPGRIECGPAGKAVRAALS